MIKFDCTHEGELPVSGKPGWCVDKPQVMQVGDRIQHKKHIGPTGTVTELLHEIIPGRGPRIRVNWGGKITICEQRNYKQVK